MSALENHCEWCHNIKCSCPKENPKNYHEMIAEDRQRLKMVYLSKEIFLDLLRNGQDGRFTKIDGLPQDAMIVGFSEHARFAYNQIVIMVWSSTFDSVPIGNHMTELVLECREVKSLGEENYTKWSEGADIPPSSEDFKEITVTAYKYEKML